jgi:DNA repair protein RecN (Recombination protein N)
MKLSFSTKGWHNSSFEEFCDVAENLRFQGVELHNIYNRLFTEKDGAFHGYAAAATLRRMYEKNLKIPCIDTIHDIGDPEKQLDVIENRLAAFARLKKKYGGTLEDVIAFRDDAKRKLRDLDGGEDRIEELRFEYSQIAKKAQSAADIISEKRREAGKRLSEEVMSALKSLDMPKVRFFVDIRKCSGEDKFNSRGTDEVNFTVITNPGEEAQPLHKIASGGELSRIMLALKCAQTRKSEQSTVIFDEIDTGVSGGTAERIGIKLESLSENIQVICVTHSAQVSAHAHNHYLIEKNEVGGRMESSVRALDGEERVSELARIIGGINVTEVQYNAARELLNKV